MEKSHAAKELISKYVATPNIIVLFVASAEDRTTLSTQLQKLRVVEWAHANIVGCLTRLDKLEGKSVRDILENSECSLEFGWVGLVCGSRLDVMDKLNLKQLCEKERRFLLKHE